MRVQLPLALPSPSPAVIPRNILAEYWPGKKEISESALAGRKRSCTSRLLAYENNAKEIMAELLDPQQQCTKGNFLRLDTCGKAF
ncbi:MAG: hypothetical protein JW764_03025 [Chlorobiaceae bacterium]|nr:hypothetical protein [Chlorobiaceae bacterium]